ncbi:MAG TPA: response regulator [Kofleriaceae bacterium]|jgi:CheY-like chemotaxis protein
MARVLVVEDDPWSQRIVRDLLEMRGHAVIVADSVGSARSQLALAPDVVLLDIHVPGGGGEALLREMRAADATRALPVVALTASAMRGDRERFLRQGFTAYLSKPIDVATFGTTIEQLLRGTA